MRRQAKAIRLNKLISVQTLSRRLKAMASNFNDLASRETVADRRNSTSYLWQWQKLRGSRT